MALWSAPSIGNAWKLEMSDEEDIGAWVSLECATRNVVTFLEVGRSRCPQDPPETSLRTVSLATPNSVASDRAVSPAATRSKISLACASVRRAWEFLSPRRSADSKPDRQGPSRPLRILSSILSCCVPMKRCPGLTHDLTSQWCNTQSPSWIGPTNSIHETRWARWSAPSCQKRPYPLDDRAPLQRVQPRASGSDTFARNLCMETPAGPGSKELPAAPSGREASAAGLATESEGTVGEELKRA
jgi:hypothetical protein